MTPDETKTRLHNPGMVRTALWLLRAWHGAYHRAAVGEEPMTFPNLKDVRIDDPIAAKAHAWFRGELQNTPPGKAGSDAMAKEFREELLNDPIALSRLFRQMAGMRGQLRLLSMPNRQEWEDKISEIISMLSFMVVQKERLE
jgi:hypothetical protein